MTLMKIEIAHPNTESFDKIILCLLDTVEIAKIGVVISNLFGYIYSG